MEPAPKGPCSCSVYWYTVEPTGAFESSRQEAEARGYVEVVDRLRVYQSLWRDFPSIGGNGMERQRRALNALAWPGGV